MPIQCKFSISHNKKFLKGQTINLKELLYPFSDGVKSLNVVTDLKQAYQTNGKSLINDFERNITLAIIDNSWKDHLRKDG